MRRQPNPDNRPHPPHYRRRTSTRTSYNQGAKWGVSIFGTLSAFGFQPENADRPFKVSNLNSKMWQPCQLRPPYFAFEAFSSRLIWTFLN